MKDSTFVSNTKLFVDAEMVKKTIRQDIHDKCRNTTATPSANSSKRLKGSCNKALALLMD